MKPVIGITTYTENKQWKAYNSISNNYINSVYLAGGIPLLIPVIADDMLIKSYLNMIDGLLFTGGVDVSPFMFGENPIKEVSEISVDRDEYELKLYEGAIKIDMPILGICRGIQFINAASGGTLYQDIFVQRENTLGHCPNNIPRDTLYHSIKIQKDSRLYNILNKEVINVNSFHHQAVKNVAENFKVTAESEDGIIEGIESTNSTFVMGVQFHPEDLPVKHPEFLKLFKALIDESIIYNEDRKNKKK
jgi:Predicted glutamine amidotransferases